MRIVKEKPPIFEQIDAAFGIAGKPVIFAFGDTIYNPMGIAITRELYAHECVHGHRQGSDVAGWWAHYIVEPEFRLAEEIPAHQAEYREFCEHNPHGRLRNGRRLYLNAIAKKLASPLYGGLISYEKARSLIKVA